MRLYELNTDKIRYQYITSDGEYWDDDEHDEDLVTQQSNDAQALIKKNGLNMLSGDELTAIALSGDKVVGVIFQSYSGGDIHWGIAVESAYGNRGIATQLYKMLEVPEYAEALVAELVLPHTLESFVKREGYELAAVDRDIKIYRKQL